MCPVTAGVCLHEEESVCIHTQKHAHERTHTHAHTSVVRLNEEESYPRNKFTRRGLTHYELEFPDCSVPGRQVVERFLAICEQEEGAVAVHCRAGLGRTGTMIALWMMSRTWRAREAIAWLRIVRPGSVLGLQQQFLEMVEDPRRQGRLNLDITPSMLEEILGVYDAGRCGHDTSVTVTVRLVCA